MSHHSKAAQTIGYRSVLWSYQFEVSTLHIHCRLSKPNLCSPNQKFWIVFGEISSTAVGAQCLTVSTVSVNTKFLIQPWYEHTRDNTKHLRLSSFKDKIQSQKRLDAKKNMTILDEKPNSLRQSAFVSQIMPKCAWFSKPLSTFYIGHFQLSTSSQISLECNGSILIPSKWNSSGSWICLWKWNWTSQTVCVIPASIV